MEYRSDEVMGFPSGQGGKRRKNVEEGGKMLVRMGWDGFGLPRIASFGFGWPENADFTAKTRSTQKTGNFLPRSTRSTRPKTSKRDYPRLPAVKCVYPQRVEGLELVCSLEKSYSDLELVRFAQICSDT